MRSLSLFNSLNLELQSADCDREDEFFSRVNVVMQKRVCGVANDVASPLSLISAELGTRDDLDLLDERSSSAKAWRW